MNERWKVQTAYDEMAGDYADVVNVDSTAEALPEPVERFRDELDPEVDLLGAGCGQSGPILDTVGRNGVGLDFSRERLVRAQTNVPASLVQGDMAAIPFVENSSDAVSTMCMSF